MHCVRALTTTDGQGLGLTRREHRRLADVLLKAAREREAIAPLSERFPELTAGDAARIRDSAVVSRIAEGERLIGAKVSLGDRSEDQTAAPGSPRLGWLTDGMLLAGSTVDLSGLISPRVEAKVAFRLARPLRGHVRDVGDLLALTDSVMPCLEITDIRYRGTDLDRVDDIADNCAAARLLLGEGVPAPPQDELLRVRVRLDVEPAPPEHNGGPPAARISPVDATLWLANRVIDEGGELEPGAHLVASPCCGPVELRSGIRVRGDFAALGRLDLQLL